MSQAERIRCRCQWAEDAEAAQPSLKRSDARYRGLVLP
jgi:hypothetical protein